MKRAIGVIVFSVLVVTIVGLIVMFSGNDSQTSTSTNTANSGSGNTSQNTGTSGNNNTGTTSGTGTSGSGTTNTSSTGGSGNTGITGKITINELANHNTQADCWVLFQGKVYDLTSWLPRHPGSPGAILPYCGNTGFEQAFINKHGTSKIQKLMQEGFYKGDFG